MLWWIFSLLLLQLLLILLHPKLLLMSQGGSWQTCMHISLLVCCPNTLFNGIIFLKHLIFLLKLVLHLLCKHLVNKFPSPSLFLLFAQRGIFLCYWFLLLCIRSMRMIDWRRWFHNFDWLILNWLCINYILLLLQFFCAFTFLVVIVNLIHPTASWELLSLNVVAAASSITIVLQVVSLFVIFLLFLFLLIVIVIIIIIIATVFFIQLFET